MSRDKIHRTPISPARAPRHYLTPSHSSPQPAPSLISSQQRQAFSPQAVTSSQRTASLSATSLQQQAPLFTSPQRVAVTPRSAPLLQQQPSPSLCTPSTLTKTPVTPSLSTPRRAPLTDHNHSDMFLASSSSFQLVDSDSDDSILLSDSPPPHSKQRPAASSPPIGLLINLRDTPLH